MRRTSNVIISISLFAALAACSGGDGATESAETKVFSEPAAVEESLSLCDRVMAGEILQAQDGVFEVCETGSTYSGSIQAGDGTWGPVADFALSGFGLETTAGGTSLNHPSSGASDGTRLVIADRFNNRVLVFNSLPTGPASPDIVLGQPDFTDISPGSTLADMNWPGAVEITPNGTLLVADTENGRILVYRSIPTVSGAAADYALDLEVLTGEADAWPWGVWSDGTALTVTDTRKGNILVWSTFPTSGDMKPTSITNPNGVGTPRNITSDGSNFLIGDENGSQPSCWGETPQNKMRQSHVWINRLPIGDPDGCVWDWYQGDSYKGGVIALAAGGREAHYWPSFPVDEATASGRVTTGASATMSPPSQPDPNVQQNQPGQPDPNAQPVEPAGSLPPLSSSQAAPQSSAAGLPKPMQDSQAGHSYLGGDGGDVVVTPSAIYFIEYNGNRVTGWLAVPENLSGKTPDFSVFDEDADISTLLRDGFIQNPVLAKAGTALVATSDYDRRMHVWTTFPGVDGAKADYIYLTGFPAWDNAYAEGTFIIAGQESMAVWRSFTPGAMPDEVVKGTIGSIAMSDIRGVAYDGTYLALADREAVSVFEGIPTIGQQPIRQYAIRGPGRLDMRDGLLAIAPREGADVYLVDVSSSNAPVKLNVRVNLPMQAKFLQTGFAIADTSFHRVQVWRDVASVRSGDKPDEILGGEIGDRPQTTSDRFYFPASLEEVNGVLYVGEFKFSNRILAFTR